MKEYKTAQFEETQYDRNVREVKNDWMGGQLPESGDDSLKQIKDFVDSGMGIDRALRIVYKDVPDDMIPKMKADLEQSGFFQSKGPIL